MCVVEGHFLPPPIAQNGRELGPRKAAALFQPLNGLTVVDPRLFFVSLHRGKRNRQARSVAIAARGGPGAQHGKPILGARGHARTAGLAMSSWYSRAASFGSVVSIFATASIPVKLPSSRTLSLYPPAIRVTFSSAFVRSAMSTS